MEYICDAEVEHLVEAWRTHCLPRPEWTHAAHLTVGVWHVTRYADDHSKAERLVRDGIRAYNAACGILNTSTSGYHETLTLFYLKAIRVHPATLNTHLPLFARTNAVLAALSDRDYPLRFYTKARLFSPEARAAWVEPDLFPLLHKFSEQ